MALDRKLTTLILQAAAIGVLQLALTACKADSASRTVPLPQLPAGSIEMRVAYLVNPRLPKMNPDQLKALLEAARVTARENFGVDLAFTEPREIPIGQAFAGIPRSNREFAIKNSFDFKTGKGDTLQLATSFGKEFRKANEPLAEQIEFASPYAPNLSKDASYEEFGREMAELQLRRLDELRRVKAVDGGPAIGASEFNEYLMWIALGYSDLPFELVLTNQLIASIEHLVPAVHSAIRGGYTNGITTYSKNARFGTMSVWSTFAFTGNDDWLVSWRNGERYTPMEAAQLAGIAATHEIGHQLFHLLHPFGRPSCVMSPVPMFAYREWMQKLAPAQCPLRSDAAMTPGAYQFHY
jgi:hypothetical protein